MICKNNRGEYEKKILVFYSNVIGNIFMSGLCRWSQWYRDQTADRSPIYRGTFWKLPLPVQ